MRLDRHLSCKVFNRNIHTHEVYALHTARRTSLLVIGGVSFTNVQLTQADIHYA